jgi:hypothetical protein
MHKRRCALLQSFIFHTASGRTWGKPELAGGPRRLPKGPGGRSGPDVGPFGLQVEPIGCCHHDSQARHRLVPGRGPQNTSARTDSHQSSCCNTPSHESARFHFFRNSIAETKGVSVGTTESLDNTSPQRQIKMEGADRKGPSPAGKGQVDSEAGSQISFGDGTSHTHPASRNIGVAGAVFLILNKMIGTGSKSDTPLMYRTGLTLCSLLNTVKHLRGNRVRWNQLADVGGW